MRSAFQALYSVLFLSLLSTALAALQASGVIFPLYIYPSADCSTWAPLISSIQAHPTVPFYVIVNPGSGPGAGAQPDANYQACTAQVRAAAGSNGNVKLLGYVSTSYGNRAANLVTADVNVYSGWSAAYRPNGIFFDEAATSAALVSTYSGYATAVKNVFSSSGLVVLNPGVQPTTTDYFTFSDIIVTAETYYSQFSTSNLVISSASPASKQSIILHTGPSTLPTALINQLTNLKIKASFISNLTNDFAYSNIPAYWSDFVTRIDNNQ